MERETFGIMEQYPHHTVKRRRQFYPLFGEAKRYNQRASSVADKLFVDAKRVYPRTN